MSLRDINEIAAEIAAQFDRGTNLVLEWMRILGIDSGAPSPVAEWNQVQVLEFGFAMDGQLFDPRKRARQLLAHALDAATWARDDITDEALTAEFVDIALRAHKCAGELRDRDEECEQLANELRHMHHEFGRE